MKTRFMLMLVLISALVLSACGAKPATTSSNTPAPGAATKAPLPPAPAATEEAPAVVPTSAPSDNGNNIDLTDVSTGLSALDSYQTTFSMSFDGTQDNQPKKWNWSTLEEFVKNPAAKHTKITSTGTGSADTGYESWEVNGKIAFMFGTTCSQSESDTPPTSGNTFTPSSIIGNIRSAQLLGSETINGIPTQHFAVDVSQFAALGLYTDSKSEAWVANPGGYVVKYFFQATGQDAFFGSGQNTQGTIRWDYEVNSVNQPINIVEPEACGKTATDIPMLPDAKNNTSIGDLNTYTSATGFDDAVNFYKTQMATNGWTADASASMSAPNFATLSFKKDTRTASVSITFDTSSNQTTVLITISK